MYRTVDSAENKDAPLLYLQDEQKTLEAYGIAEWNCIKVCRLKQYLVQMHQLMGQVENTDPNARPEGEFTDLSAVNKFELTNEEYEARQGPCSLCSRQS